MYYERNGGQAFEVIPMSHNRLYFEDTLSYMQINNTGTDEQSMGFYYFLSEQPEVARKIE